MGKTLSHERLGAGCEVEGSGPLCDGPDDPRRLASQLAALVQWEEIALRERGDLELTLHVVAENAYDAGRTALDRVRSATAETESVAPELLEVNVLCMYGGVDPDARS
jgi:hypothetical protein